MSHSLPTAAARRTVQRRLWPHLTATVAVLVFSVPVAGMGLFRFWPGYVPVPADTRLVIGGYACQSPALVDRAERLYLPFATVKSMLDPGMELDTETMTVKTSTAGRTITFPSPALEEFANRRPVELRAQVATDASGSPYVPADFLASLLGLTYEFHPETNTAVVDRVGEVLPTVVVRSSPAFIRQKPSLLSERLSRLEPGTVLAHFGEEGDWLLVRDQLGNLGYLPRKGATAGSPITISRPEPVPSPAPIEGPVSLVWEHVSSRNPDPAAIGDLPGVNVVSPTWFHVMNSEGRVSNLGDLAYVEWAHQHGYQVWGLVTNGFSRDRTRAFLPDAAKREDIIRTLLIYARLYRLDGINMDFENMYLTEKDDYVALIRELAPHAREMGLALSVDVTFLSSSEVWSRCFDRPALAEICDYVMVMGYDQHTAGSPVAGPVGAIPWVEQGLERILAEIPPQKLVLGVPFYTRLWAEVPGSRPKVTTYSMQGVRDLIAEKGLTPTWDAANGSYFITYVEDGVRHKLWIEDETSMAARLRLIEQYDLAGVAAWRRGFEVPVIWQLIERELDAGR